MSQHILVPVDGSPQSEAAFDYVLDNHPDAQVTILHVLNPASTYTYGDDEYFDYEGYQAEAKRQHERAEQLLEEYGETASEHSINFETRLETGKPAAKIIETVEDEDIDHIVMGSRGRSGVGRVLFGSVAETVTRRAPVPVTIVR
ncbi:universal stress protein [Halobacterium sp. KA-6]|jgi:nucleotide-binding universal stress UspA family protein|uniref:universal stress protein n=1 Tax=Halobacterium sp. KA-6 TaxID=2896368 RepID=UPI001E4DD89D|nr:universal stress protein [Halobacterium sp. KA-6]MCD2205070.1 universal stress protein [Halobacterium sp. KA-6]